MVPKRKYILTSILNFYSQSLRICICKLRNLLVNSLFLARKNVRNTNPVRAMSCVTRRSKCKLTRTVFLKIT